MRLPRRRFCALLGLAAAGVPMLPAGATVVPRSGAEYLVLSPPQPTGTGAKVEVIEFFAYYCPHCYAFEPILHDWVSRQGENIVFRRVHVPRDANVLPQQRLFFTLEAMDLLDRYHDKVFAAMHVDHLRLNSDEQVVDWAARNGIERAAFVEAYRSPGIQAKLNRAGRMLDAYHVDRWPMLAVDGRFLTSPSQANERAGEGRSEAQQQQAALQVLDYLVAKAKADKG